MAASTLSEHRIAFSLWLDWHETSAPDGNVTFRKGKNRSDSLGSQHSSAGLRKDGQQLTSGEENFLVLRSEHYAVRSLGLDLLDQLLAGPDSAGRSPRQPFTRG